jgi:hypothetical protein
MPARATAADTGAAGAEPGRARPWQARKSPEKQGHELHAGCDCGQRRAVRAAYLPLRRYEIGAKANGLQASAQEALVTLGSSVSGSFNLSVEGKTESVRVTDPADTPGIEPKFRPSASYLAFSFASDIFLYSSGSSLCVQKTSPHSLLGSWLSDHLRGAEVQGFASTTGSSMVTW